MSTSPIKIKIISDFIIAFKNKKFFRKDTLNLIKSEIIKKEKEKGNNIEDTDIIQILKSMIKQRSQTIASYAEINLPDDKILNAIQLERDQIDIITEYLPTQMSDDQLKIYVNEFIEIHGSQLNENLILPEIMKYFKKFYNGTYDQKKLSEETKKLIQS